jgi:multiple sugar transport system permease protein
MTSESLSETISGPEKESKDVDTLAFARSERRVGLLLILPTALVMALMILFPFFYAIWLSFLRKSPISPKASFIGFENYAYIFKDSEYWHSFNNGIIWTGSSIILMLVFGIGIALLMHQNFRGRSIFRGLVLFPYMVPTIVATLVWQWLFNDMYGIVNHFLESIGVINAPLVWLGDPFWAMVTCIFVNVWKFTPFVVIVILARLQTIPQEFYEAAKMDGASAWGRFWTITLPQLRSVLIIVILLRFLWTYRNFDIIWLLTRGGPLISTQNLPVYGYRVAFLSMFMGRGAAIAVTIFVFLAILCFLFLRLTTQKEVDSR